jgi:hypothetical protein
VNQCTRVLNGRFQARVGVFPTGSIAWYGASSHNGYDDNVARITGNVLPRFLDPAPVEGGELPGGQPRPRALRFATTKIPRFRR